jgi:hypothetical protein
VFFEALHAVTAAYVWKPLVREALSFRAFRYRPSGETMKVPGYLILLEESFVGEYLLVLISKSQSSVL